MNLLPTALQDTFIVEPKLFRDDRGFFYESYNEAAFNAALGKEIRFVQDNHSRSTRGVLRGLHYQIHHAQGKLVRVVRGAVFDVAVDLRRSSPSFGKWIGVELTEENARQFWIPPGFAHGFTVLSETADFLYKATDIYSPADERCILWNDPTLGIAWPEEAARILSPKDLKGVPFAQAETYE